MSKPFLTLHRGEGPTCVNRQLFLKSTSGFAFRVFGKQADATLVEEKNFFFDTSELSSDFSTSYMALFPKIHLPPLLLARSHP